MADTGNSIIRKITAAGEISLLAGKQGTVGTRDGTGSAAWFAFDAPTGGFAMALDGAGNFYVPNRNTVRKVTPEGVVTTLAGKAGSSGTVDGTGAAARFQVLSGMAVDGSGNVYVSDYGLTVRKITAEGVVTTLAGKADTRGYVDGTGADARFGQIMGIVADKAGNLFVADNYNNCIRKITPDGAVTTIAGRPSHPGIADGKGTAARFLSPVALAVDSTGNLAVADSSYKDLRQFFFFFPGYETSAVRKVSPAGVVTTLAGRSDTVGGIDGINAMAPFNGLNGAAFDGVGNLYVADAFYHKIWKVTSAGVVTRFAGSPVDNWEGDVDGASEDARFFRPLGLARDVTGNLYVADSRNGKIRKVTPEGVVTTLAAVAGVGLAVDADGNLFVSSARHTISKVSPGGVVTLLAGSPSQASMADSGWVDGLGSQARFNNPAGLALDGTGNLFVADQGNGAVRKITPAGRVTTVAGAWRQSAAGLSINKGGKDGTGGSAGFNEPVGIAVDKAGNLYVSDAMEGTIRVGFPATILSSSGPGFGFNAGRFGFKITGQEGRLAVVEASTDLLNWLPIWTNTITGALDFSDPDSAAFPFRHYRARLP